jgi:hypothetical protein
LSIARTMTSRGYWILLSNGQVVAFGDAKPWGAPVNVRGVATRRVDGP